MIKFEHIDIHGWEAAIRGMRNPMNSWEKSDSLFLKFEDTEYNISTLGDINGNRALIRKNEMDSALEDYGASIGPNDHALMMKLAKAGSEHSKYRRFITVTMDIMAPLYWWKEFDTYKVGTVANSCSTMHKIHAKEFELDDFSHEHLIESGYMDKPTDIAIKNLVAGPKAILGLNIDMLNICRNHYLKTKDKETWWQMIQLLPSSYNQKRTVMLNYEVLAHICQQRKDHKLDEWHDFCDMIKTLPYSEIITLEEDK